MKKFDLDNISVTVKALNMAEKALYQHQESKIEIAGNIFTKCDITLFDGSKKAGGICVNDFYIFDKNKHLGWVYFADTLKYKESSIPAHADVIYPLLCDAGCFVINGLRFRNGIGDGEFKLIIRTVQSYGSSQYYSRAELYHAAQKIYPENGICKIKKYDCGEEYYDFDNVKEIQIVDGKVYVICEG
jgi:hypothetical protein